MKHSFVMTSRTYELKLTEQEFLNWDKYWNDSNNLCHVIMGNFITFISIDWSGHYGANLYITLSSSSELTAILNFIEARIR